MSRAWWIVSSHRPGGGTTRKPCCAAEPSRAAHSRRIPCAGDGRWHPRSCAVHVSRGTPSCHVPAGAARSRPTPHWSAEVLLSALPRNTGAVLRVSTLYLPPEKEGYLGYAAMIPTLIFIGHSGRALKLSHPPALWPAFKAQKRRRLSGNSSPNENSTGSI